MPDMQRKDIVKSLSSIVDAFSNSAVNLFEVTRPPLSVTYEKALYQEMYIKPNKRLAKIFSTDREVLVLVTNFSDQQQRTVAFVKSQLQAAVGRLEATLAIVVHADPDGNLKLKKWGRELGVSVLRRLTN